MDLQELPEDMCDIINNYEKQLKTIIENRKIKKEIRRTYIFTEVSNQREEIIVTSRYNILKKTKVVYSQQKRGLYGYKPGLYIEQYGRLSLKNVICIHKEKNKEKIINEVHEERWRELSEKYKWEEKMNNRCF